MNTDLKAGDVVRDCETKQILVITSVTADYIYTKLENEACSSYRYYDASSLEKIGVVSKRASADQGQFTTLDQVVTISEVSALYGVEVSTVRRACIGGWIPARKSGSTWLVLRADAMARWGKRLPAHL